MITHPNLSQYLASEFIFRKHCRNLLTMVSKEGKIYVDIVMLQWFQCRRNPIVSIIRLRSQSMGMANGILRSWLDICDFRHSLHNSREKSS